MFLFHFLWKLIYMFVIQVVVVVGVVPIEIASPTSFSNVSKRFRLNVIQCVFNAFYWHSVGINLNRLFSSYRVILCMVLCIFYFGWLLVFISFLYSFWHRNEAIKKVMIKRKTSKCWQERIKKPAERITEMHSTWCDVWMRCDLCVTIRSIGKFMGTEVKSSKKY